MLRIPCPHCGSTRDEDEFTYGGPFDRVRPTDPQQLDDREWAEYLFSRDNPRGPSLERWRHTFGCRQWFGVERDTMTHVLTRVFALSEIVRTTDKTALSRGDLNETI